MRGSIELARTICEELKGELPEGEQYGSVDVAEILSAHVRNLEDQRDRFEALYLGSGGTATDDQNVRDQREYFNHCTHEWYQGRCVHCDVAAKDGRPA